VAAAVGAWLLFGLLHALGRRWLRVALLVVVLAGLLFGVGGLRPTTEADADALEQVLSFDQLLRHTRLGMNPWLPSAWMSKAVLYWSQGLGGTAGFYALLLLSNAALALALVFDPASRWFSTTYAMVSAGRSRRMQERQERRRLRARHRGGLAWLIDALPFTRQSRALLLKDVRLFLRDPSQWSQFGIFLGLLLIYIVNLRNVAFTTQSPFWTSVISYLNLLACSLTLSTLTTRFVFPQFSLEGRRLWILGLAPYGVERMLLQHFVTNSVLTGLVTSLLMVGSGAVLNLPWATTLAFCAVMLVMSATLSGIAAGLGMLFPNLKEENPSKIVTGFGGTLCLVLSFIYIVVTVGLTALPAMIGFSGGGERRIDAGWLQWVSGVGLVVVSVGFLLATLIPAYRKAKRLEI